MNLTHYAALGVIVALSLMFIGGLVLWAYGARMPRGNLVPIGLETEATRRFHEKLVRWFLIYGAALVIIGFGLLLWAGAYFLKS